MAEAIPKLQNVLQSSEYSILESNSVMEFIQPRLFVVVVDPAQQEFKGSALRFLERAHAIVARGFVSPAAWNGRGKRIAASAPVFIQPIGEPLPAGLLALIRNGLFPTMHPGTPREHLPG